MNTNRKSGDIFAYDEAGDVHVVTPSQRDSILSGDEVYVPMAGDDYSVRLMGIMPPLGGVGEGVDGVDPDDTVQP